MSKLKRINKDQEIDELYGACQCPKEDFVNYTKYYDSPDGCDIPKKVQVAARYGILTGLLFSTVDVLMYSHAVGLGNILSRYLVHTVPLGLMGATFAAVANGSQIYRGDKDDGLNYFLGGLACGPLVGYYLKNRHGVLLGGLALGVIGAIKKKSLEEGHILMGNYQSHMGMVNSWRHDYTLSHDPRDDWMEYCKDMQEEDRKKKKKKKKYCLDDWVQP